MPGRNDPCPCGSGRKYKKCCLQDKAPNAKVKAGPPQSRYLNYAELVKIVSIDELPLIGITSGASAKIFLNDLIEYIESETDIEVAWFSNEEGGRAFEFTFNTNRSGDDYYNDDYYNDDCDSDDDENSEISVLIDEKSFAGSLQSAALQDGDPVEIADVLFEVNASLYMVWQALAQTPQARGKNKLAPQLLSVIAQVREGFEKLTAERDSKIKQNELIFANLAQTRLDSMLVLLSSKFADETSSHDLQSKFPLPESTQLSKTPPLLDPKMRAALGLVPKNTEENFRNIPPVFWANANEIYGFWGSPDHLTSVADSVWFGFSDGTSLSAREILRHSYALLVPPDLLPGGIHLSKHDKFWRKNFAILLPSEMPSAGLKQSLIKSMNWGNDEVYGGYRGPFYEAVEQTIGAIFIAAAQRLNRGEIALSIAYQNSDCKSSLEKLKLRSAKIPSLRLNRVELGADSLFHWETHLQALALGEKKPLQQQIGSASENEDNKEKSDAGAVQLEVMTGRFSLRKNHSDVSLLPLTNGFVNVEARSLWMHPLREELSHFAALNSGPSAAESPLSDAIRVQANIWPDYQIDLDIRGAEAIQDIADRLQSKKSGAYFLDWPDIKKVQATPEIHLGPDGRFAFARRLMPLEQHRASEQMPFLNGFSNRTLELLATFNGQGCASYFKMDAKNLASRNRRTRDFELKVLKHQGVLNLLVFESFHARFRGCLTDGVKVTQANAILRHLEPKILTLMGEWRATDVLGAEGGAQAPKLSEFCTKAVLSKLQEVIEDHFSGLSKKAFQTVLPEGEVIIDAFVEQEFRMIFALMEFAAIASRGDIFAKARLNLLSLICPLHETRLTDMRILLSRDRRSEFAATATATALLRLPFAQVAPSEGSEVISELRQSLSVFQPLLAFGFEIYFGAQKLHELTAGEFTTVLNVKEDKPNVPGALTSQRMNWFELNPKFFLKGKEIQGTAANQLLTGGMIEHAGQMYLVPIAQLPNLRRLSLFWNRLRKGKGMRKGDYQDAQQSFYRLPKSQVLEMLALRSAGVSVIGGAQWQEIFAFYESLDGPKREASVSNLVKGELKNYQKIGVQRLYDLYRLGLGSILADDMGLGKTLQVLAFIAQLRDENRLGKVLIVVPTSLTYNWLSERDKFVPDFPVFEFSAKSKESMPDFLNESAGGVVLTTYGLLQEHQDFLKQIEWNLVIFDEAQNLKNISAQRTTVARALSANVKICLTGTPLENHLGEFFSLLDLAVPGCLGELDEFKKIYVNPSAILYDDLKFLKLKSRPLVLRRTKNEILAELPDKQESRVTLPFEEKQKKIYRDVAISYNEKIQKAIADDGESKCQLQMLTALLRLRQVCSDPAALPGVKYSQTPPKIEALAESLIEVVDSGESALVFTQFLSTLERTEKILRALRGEEGQKMPVFVIHGGIAQKQRETVLREFNAVEGGAVLLMTLKTGGVGLNLTKASYVFHLEPWWNPAVENQATDRAHRMGQKRSVQVYRYVMLESVEEKIERLKLQKQKRFDALFAEIEDVTSTDFGKNQISSQGAHLSKEDFSFLLST